MSRRIPTSRHPSLESLEARCNPAALDPLAGAFAEAAPTDESAIGPGQSYTYTLDPRTVGADAGTGVATGSSAGAGLPNVQVRDLELNQTTNAFAGQTVRIKFEAADASTASGTHYFDGRFLRADDLMSEPAPRASIGGISDLMVDPRNRDTVYLSGTGRDVLVGGAGQDQIETGISKFGSRRLILQGDGTYAGNDDNNHGTHVAGTIGAVGNNGGGPATSGFAYAVLTVGGASHGEKIDDIVVGAEANGHVKVFDGATGAEIRSFLAFEGVYLGGAGRDVLVGGAGQDTQTAHELGHTLGFRHEHTRPDSDSPAGGGISKLGSKLLVIQGDGTYDTNDNNGHGTHVAGTIAAEGNNGVGVAGSTITGTTGTFRLSFNGETSTFSRPDLESLIDDLARDVAEATASGLSHIQIKTYQCPSY